MDHIIEKLNPLNIRKYSGQILDILHSYPDEYWGMDNLLFDLPGKYEYSLVSVNEETVNGYIIASRRNDTTIHIHKYFVRKDKTGMGVGTALFFYLKKLAKKDGVNTISLKVEYDNLKAIAFYSKKGFNKNDTVTDSKTGKYLLVMKIEIL